MPNKLFDLSTIGKLAGLLGVGALMGCSTSLRANPEKVDPTQAAQSQLSSTDNTSKTAPTKTEFELTAPEEVEKQLKEYGTLYDKAAKNDQAALNQLIELAKPEKATFIPRFYLGRLFIQARNSPNGKHLEEQGINLLISAINSGYQPASEYLASYLYYKLSETGELSIMNQLVPACTAFEKPGDVCALILGLISQYEFATTSMNIPEAIKFYEMAAEKNPEAAYMLARIYFYGIGVAQDPVGALKIFNAIAPSFAPAKIFTTLGKGDLPSAAESKKLVAELTAYDKTNLSKNFNSALGEYYYLTGMVQISKNNLKGGLASFQQAIKYKNVPASTALGLEYLGISKNFKLAKNAKLGKQLLEHAATFGDTLAQFHLGVVLVNEQEARGLDHLSNALLKGYEPAILVYSELYKQTTNAKIHDFLRDSAARACEVTKNEAICKFVTEHPSTTPATTPNTATQPQPAKQ